MTSILLEAYKGYETWVWLTQGLDRCVLVSGALVWLRYNGLSLTVQNLGQGGRILH